jgi:GT2 family glycosyltransferase
MTKRVTVIILNWNGWHHLERCLPALLAQTYLDFEIVVVDNGSADGSAALVQDRFPQVRLIANSKNLGFAQANNQAIQSTSSPYIVTLNNDTRPEPTWLEEMARAMEANAEIGMVASKVLYMAPPHLVDSAGIEIDRAGFAWNRYNGQPDSAEEHEPYEVFGPNAAAALYRREMLDDVGFFDASFFAYYEDVDLAWRARMMGWSCLYVPRASVYHVHSATSRQGSPLKQHLLARNKLWTILKNYPAPALWLNLPTILFYDLLAALFRAIMEGNTSPIHGRLVALGRLPAVLRQRRAIQRRRRISWRTMSEWMIPPPSLLRSLRHLQRIAWASKSDTTDEAVVPLDNGANRSA